MEARVLLNSKVFSRLYKKENFKPEIKPVIENF